MIIWLASYQRSGSAFLQTLLRQSLGFHSYTRHQEAFAQQAPRGLEADYTVPWPEPWSEFYRAAVRSRDLHFVKTHSPPIDNLPTIHIVRDGRNAMLSHWEVLRSTHPGKIDLFASIEGAATFRPWSQLVAGWRDHASQAKLELRYEELIAGGDALLRRVADFVGHRGDVRPWDACAKNILRLEPDFFSRRRPHWVRPPEWTEAIDAAFEARHGWLMDELGYFAGRPGRRLRHAAKRALNGVGLKRREIHALAP